jgi:hypothetical protein
VRTEEEIQKDVRVFLVVKLLISVLAMIACIALWFFGQHWSLLAKVITFGGMLIFLAITFTIGVLESGAHANSSSSPSAFANYSGLANGLIALTFLLTLATGIGLAFK